jgi:hypothetical protein
MIFHLRTGLLYRSGKKIIIRQTNATSLLPGGKARKKKESIPFPLNNQPIEQNSRISVVACRKLTKQSQQSHQETTKPAGRVSKSNRTEGVRYHL